VLAFKSAGTTELPGLCRTKAGLVYIKDPCVLQRGSSCLALMNIFTRGKKNKSYPKQATDMFLLVSHMFRMVGSATNPLDQYISPELVYTV
jgi:hypothetical protein